MFTRRFLVIAFLTLSLDRWLTTLQLHFTFDNFETDMIQLIPKKARVCLGFRAKSLPFCIVYRFVWSQICFTSSFKLVVPSNISNGLAFSGISNNTCASGMHFFALTNLDVRFHSNSVTFFVIFLPGGSSISKSSPSTWAVASGVRI